MRLRLRVIFDVGDYLILLCCFAKRVRALFYTTLNAVSKCGIGRHGSPQFYKNKVARQLEDDKWGSTLNISGGPPSVILLQGKPCFT